MNGTAKVYHDAQIRWIRGREEHRHGPWHGRAPLEEFYEEMCDAVNYALEHGRQNPRQEEWAKHVALRCALLAAEIAERID